MFNAKFWISRTGQAIAAAVLALNLSTAHALVINATTTFDDAFGFGLTSGSFFVTSGGATTSASYSGSTASANPLTGPLTAVFDGSGFSGSAFTAANDPEFAIGFDTEISVFNDTGSAQNVEFRLDFSNMVNADGGDAFADSELTLQNRLPGDAGFSEIFFSDLVSDTSFGDAIGGIATGLFGESLMENGTQVFGYTLLPGEQVDLWMSWTLSGGDFLDGLAEASLSADLKLVPLPGSLLFMASGVLLLPLQRLLRKRPV